MLLRRCCASTKTWLLALLLLPFTALSSEKLLIVTEEWAPYNYTNEAGEVVGLATENIKKIMALADMDYDLRVLPWSMAYTLTQKKSNVMLYTIYRTKERERKFQWVCPIISSGGIKAYKLSKRQDIRAAILSDLKKYNIAVSNKNVQYEYLIAQGFRPGIDLDITTTTDASLRLLLLGRVDVIMQEDAAIKARLHQLNQPNDIVTPVMTILPDTVEKCAAFSRSTSPKIIERLTNAVNQLAVSS